MTNLEKFKINYPDAPLKPNGLPEQIRCPYQLGLPFKDKCISPDDCPGCWGMKNAKHDNDCEYIHGVCVCSTCANDSNECCCNKEKDCFEECPDYIKEGTK